MGEKETHVVSIVVPSMYVDLSFVALVSARLLLFLASACPSQFSFESTTTAKSINSQHGTLLMYLSARYRTKWIISALSKTHSFCNIKIECPRLIMDYNVAEQS